MMSNQSSDISPEELIARFQGEPSEELGYSTLEIMSVFQKVAIQEDDELFKRVIEAYIDFFVRYNIKRGNPNFREETALQNIGAGSAIVDWKSKHIINKGGPKECYLAGEEHYGPTMKAFARYVGKSGNDLVELVLAKSGRA